MPPCVYDRLLYRSLAGEWMNGSPCSSKTAIPVCGFAALRCGGGDFFFFFFLPNVGLESRLLCRSVAQSLGGRDPVSGKPRAGESP